MSSYAVFTENHKVFSTGTPSETLYNIAKMDLATEEIQESLLNAERLGQKQFHAFSRNIDFVKRWMFTLEIFCDSQKHIKAPAFASLCVVKKQTRDKEVTI